MQIPDSGWLYMILKFQVCVLVNDLLIISLRSEYLLMKTGTSIFLWSPTLSSMAKVVSFLSKLDTIFSNLWIKYILFLVLIHVWLKCLHDCKWLNTIKIYFRMVDKWFKSYFKCYSLKRLDSPQFLFNYLMVFLHHTDQYPCCIHLFTYSLPFSSN